MIESFLTYAPLHRSLYIKSSGYSHHLFALTEYVHQRQRRISGKIVGKHRYSLCLSYSVLTKALLVPLAPSAVESVCFVQFQRVRQAQDERRIPRTQRGVGREGSAGSHTQRIEGATGHEGAYSPFKNPLQIHKSGYRTIAAALDKWRWGLILERLFTGISRRLLLMLRM